MQAQAPQAADVKPAKWPWQAMAPQLPSSLPRNPSLPPWQDKKLSAYDFEGVKQREWTMDAVIRYIKVRFAAGHVHAAAALHALAVRPPQVNLR